MANQSSGRWVKSDNMKGRVIEHGMQPAQMQFRPAPRPAATPVKPAPAAKKSR